MFNMKITKLAKSHWENERLPALIENYYKQLIIPFYFTDHGQISQSPTQKFLSMMKQIINPKVAIFIGIIKGEKMGYYSSVCN